MSLETGCQYRENTLDILGYNVCIGGYDSVHKGNPRRLPLIKEVITRDKPDFVVVCEAFNWRNLFPTDKALADNFGFKNAGIIRIMDEDNAEDTEKDGAIAILSNLPVYVNTIKTYDRSLGVASVEVSSNMGPTAIDVVATYLHTPEFGDPDRRGREMEELVRQMTSSNPQILVGDFNSVGKNEMRIMRLMLGLLQKYPKTPRVTKIIFNALNYEPDQILAENNFINLERRPKATFPTKLPVLPLDRGYVRNLGLSGIEVVDVKVPKNRFTLRASDHLPKEFRLKIQGVSERGQS